MDVVLNFHTAFYDESGDLCGIKLSNSSAKTKFRSCCKDNGSRADLPTLYRNYVSASYVASDPASTILPSTLDQNLTQVYDRIL